MNVKMQVVVAVVDAVKSTPVEPTSHRRLAGFGN